QATGPVRAGVTRGAAKKLIEPPNRDTPFRVGFNAFLDPVAASAVQSNEAARLHQPSRQRHNRLAACGACTAAAPDAAAGRADCTWRKRYGRTGLARCVPG